MHEQTAKKVQAIRWNRVPENRGGRRNSLLRAVSAAIMVVSVLALPATGAQELLLYDNGPVTGTTHKCDQGPTGCGGTGTWTYYDNFVLGIDATITDFDYVNQFFSGGPGNYVLTNWSIFDSDPFTSSPIASGTAVAALIATGPDGQFLFEVSGLSVSLSAGVEYWLGINNTVTGGILTVPAAVADPGGGLRGSKQSDGGIYDFNLFFLDRAFRIFGPTCFAIDAIDDGFSVINDGTTADLLVLGNDECSADTPISVVELPGDLLPDRGGSAITDGSTVNYTPAAGYVGVEEFTYTAQDAGLKGGENPPAVDQDTATVMVDVLEDLTPDAVDDLAMASETQAAFIDVLGNDFPGNTPSVVEIESEPTNGSATVQAHNIIRYSPNFGFFGEDNFEYRLTDANGDSDIASVAVCVLFGSGQFPIDIMPSDPGNNLNLRAGKGASITIAILSPSEFCGAPNLIDPSTLKFGPGQASISGSPHVRDEDGDGDEDLIVKFPTNDTGIACGDTSASLSGRTFDSRAISGSDAVNTFNCPRTRKRW